MEYTHKIEEIFKDTFVEINKNHDEALTAINNFYKITNDKKLPILVNYDSHSDLFLNTKITEQNIANWVNIAISEFGINEYFWILPNYITNNNLFFKTHKSISEHIITGSLIYNYADIFTEKINKIEAYINEPLYEIITIPRINKINKKYMKFEIEKNLYNFKKLIIYIISLNNIDILKNREIILSIDADAFCNSGFDTPDNINNKDITVNDLKTEFNILADALHKNNIRPLCTSLTRSPAYFPKKFENELYQFFEDIKKASVCDIDKSML